MPNEMHTLAGMFELPDSTSPERVEVLLLIAGTGWVISRAAGMWMAEKRGPGNQRRYLTRETAPGGPAPRGSSVRSRKGPAC